MHAVDENPALPLEPDDDDTEAVVVQPSKDERSFPHLSRQFHAVVKSLERAATDSCVFRGCLVVSDCYGVFVAAVNAHRRPRSSIIDVEHVADMSKLDPADYETAAEVVNL